jgi:sensor histidine kinase YesM
MVDLWTACINTVLFVFPGLVMVLITFRGKYRFKHIVPVVVIQCVIVVFLQYWLLSLSTLPLPARMASGVINFAATFVMVKSDISRIVYAVLTAAAYTIFLQNLCDIILMLLPMNRSLLNLILLILTYPMAILFVAKVLRKTIEIKDRGTWAVIWVLPGIIAVEGLFIVYFGYLLYLSPYIMLLLLFMFILTLMLTLSIIPKFLHQTAEWTALTMEVERVGTQIEIEREQYRRLTDSVAAARQMRHDLRHHLAVIDAYADDIDIAKIHSYIHEITSENDRNTEIRYCENQGVNAIVGHYLSGLHENQIDVKVRLVIPEDTGRIKTADLCVLLGNILENAATAVQKARKPYIHFVSDIRNGFMNFVVENSTGEIGKLDDEGHYISSKTGQAGVGLSSVHAICERYGGFCEIEAQEYIWRIRCILAM